MKDVKYIDILYHTKSCFVEGIKFVDLDNKTLLKIALTYQYEGSNFFRIKVEEGSCIIGLKANLGVPPEEASALCYNL